MPRLASGAGSLAGRGRRGWPSRTCGWCRSRRGRRPGSAVPVTTSPAPGPRASDRSSSHRPGRARGRRIRPARSSARTPSGGQAAARAASLSAGGAATASARSSRSIAATMVGSGSRAAGAVPGRRSSRSSRVRRPSRTSSSTRPAAADARCVPAERDAAAELPGGDGSGGGQGHGSVDRLDHRSADVRAHIRGDRDGSGHGLERTVEVEPGRRDRGPIARSDGRREPRHALDRLPAARDPAGRRDVEHGGRRRPVPVPDVRRRTARSPGATAIGAARRSVATEVPSGRSSASRPLRPTRASTAAVPACRRTRDRSGRARRIATRIRSLADDRWIVRQDRSRDGGRPGRRRRG